ncbi:hypothetical protein BC567DRAFT_252876 [Phyllosticta citribraziliensis]
MAALGSPADPEKKLEKLRETVWMANVSLDAVHALLAPTLLDFQVRVCPSIPARPLVFVCGRPDLVDECNTYDELLGITFLGVINLHASRFLKVPWSSRRLVMAEMRRWMALVSFDTAHRVKDCQELLRDVASKLRSSLMKTMREEELPRLKRNGVIREGGDWDFRTRFLRTLDKVNDSWLRETRVDAADAVLPPGTGHAQREDTWHHGAERGGVQGKVRRVQAVVRRCGGAALVVFGRFEADYVARGWHQGDKLLAGLFKEHEQAGCAAGSIRRMLGVYCWTPSQSGGGERRETGCASDAPRNPPSHSTTATRDAFTTRLATRLQSSRGASFERDAYWDWSMWAAQEDVGQPSNREMIKLP